VRSTRPERLGRRTAFLAFLALGVAACGGTNTGPPSGDDLLSRLDALPGVTAREITPHYGYPRAFQLDVVQPVDHADPQGPTFTQRAYLSHAGEERPMVFGAYGYGATDESGEELAEILRGNGLYVTHRYFPGARPDPANWRHLDIRQAAADHHRIVTLLKEVYRGTWVSAGASKSGMTALFHRRFHPSDVSATVAYVAPLMFEVNDERFLPWLAAIGTPEERAHIHAFQRRLLEHEEGLLPHFEGWFARNGYTLSLPPGPIFESAVASYEWEFWQRHVSDLDDIPGAEAPYELWVDHLARVVRLHYSSDTWRDYFRAYVYQVHTQIGGAAVDAALLSDLVRHQPLDPHAEYGFPANLPLTWDGGAAMRDVLLWIQTEGDRILLIYGGVDPWTGGAIDTAGNPWIVKVIQPGADHQVRIANLDRRDEVLGVLGSWLGMPVTPPTGALARVPGAEPELGPARGVFRFPAPPGTRP
jgi:hypothetical protein